MATSNDGKVLDSFGQVCRAHGLKVTPQRRLIYSELMASEDHPTLEMIYQRVRQRAPDISFDTVYRTLATFREIGLVQAVDGFGTSMRFDPKCEPHHHFRCVKCQTIIDFADPEYDALEVPATIRRRCEVTNVRVTVEGLCGKCKRGGAGKAKGKR